MRDLIQFGAGEKENIARALLQFLDRPDAAGRLMTAMGGFLFEDWLEQTANDYGFSCENVSAERLPYDLVINGHRIQAKSSASQDGRVDVRPVRPKVGSTVRRYLESDFDILAVHLAAYGEKYLVPVSHFKCTQFQGMISGTFTRNQSVAWRDAWNVVSDAPGTVMQQQQMSFLGSSS